MPTLFTSLSNTFKEFLSELYLPQTLVHSAEFIASFLYSKGFFNLGFYGVCFFSTKLRGEGLEFKVFYCSFSSNSIPFTELDHPPKSVSTLKNDIFQQFFSNGCEKKQRNHSTRFIKLNVFPIILLEMQ